MTYDERVMQFQQATINDDLRNVSAIGLIKALYARFDTLIWSTVFAGVIIITIIGYLYT